MKFSTAKASKGGADTKVKEKKKAEDKAANSHESVELSKDLSNAITWLGGKFGTIRQWVGKEGGDYASITPKAKVKCPKPYESVSEVAEAVIESLKEVGEAEGMAIFASYALSFRGNRAVGRLISVSDDGKLVLALEIEYAVGSAKGGIQAMVPRTKDDASGDEKEVEVDEDAGFGAL